MHDGTESTPTTDNADPAASSATLSGRPRSGLTAGEGFAADRVYRILTFSLSCTTVLLLGANLTAIGVQSAVVTLGLTIPAVLAVSLPSLTQLVIGFTAPRPWLARIWGVQALGMLAVWVGFGVVVPAGGIPLTMYLTWLGELTVIAGIASILTWPRAGAIWYGSTLSAVLVTVAVVCGEGQLHGTAVGAALRIIFYTLMFTFLAGALLRTSRVLDDTVDRAVAEARSMAERDATRASRRAIRMLVHDSIIVVLLAYADDLRSAAVRGKARTALEEIERSPEPLADDADLDSREVVRELQVLSAALDSQIRVEAAVSVDELFPSTVVGALVAATAEALRNSIRHAPADRTVTREVHVDVGSDRIEVTVLDDGRGFDPAAIPEVRLGVRNGILDRINDLDGGSAQVVSRIGHGTTVVIRWVRP